jgi:CRISPR-associated protein Cmr1
MPELRLAVDFVTPAFIGGADQSGEWRVPPFKALLRQWWRLLMGAYHATRNQGIATKELRKREGVGFGHAWLDDLVDDGRKKTWAFRSPLRMQLGQWKPGDLQNAQLGPDPQVFHPEVGQAGRDVGALLYLGYGPLTYQGGTRMKAPPAVAPGTAAEWIWRWRDGTSAPKESQLKWLALLIHWFGTVGGRSRNGWGSIQLFKLDGSPFANLDDTGFLKSVSIDLERCLAEDWPYAIGADQKGPLVWVAKEMTSTWQEAIQLAAGIKIAFRTSLQPGSGGIAQRHILGYPVTNHSVRAWGNQARLANQLRFKVHRVQGSGGKDEYVPIAFHLPHRLPDALLRNLSPADQRWVRENELDVWSNVHAVLDERMARLA